MNFSKNEKLIAEYYIAAFGRTPDQSGLNYWVDQYETGEKTLGQIRDAFTMDTNIVEVAARFPADASTEDFVTSIYVNVLSRQPDQGGLDYWIGRMNSKGEDSIPKNELLTYMLNAAKSSSNDLLTLTNKLEAADYFLEMIPIEEQTTETIFSLDTITNTVDSLINAKNIIDELIGDNTNAKNLNPKEPISEYDKLLNREIAEKLGIEFDDTLSWMDNYKKNLEGNDVNDGVDTPYEVEVNSNTSGNLQWNGDEDWYEVIFEANQKYRIDLEGIDTGKGTLCDPYLRGIYNSDGILISGTSNDDSGPYNNANRYPDFNSRVEYTPVEDGIYYIEAGAYNNKYTGTFTLSVIEIA